MASRKEQKEQARAARIAQQEQAAAKAQRTRRIQIFGGATAIAVIVIVVAIVVSSGGSGKHGSPLLKPGSRAERQLVSSVSSGLSSIPQSGTTLGKPSAKVTMIYFGDLQCPICQAFTLGVFPQFVQDEVKTGKVKVTFRSSCTATCSDYHNGQKIFTDQQVAAYAAGKQNKFWDYAELFYHQQGAEGSGYVTSAFIKGVAKQVPGLNLATWQSDRNDSALAAQVRSDQTLANQEARAAGQKYNTTPTLLLEGPKGTEVAAGTDKIDGENFGFPSLSELEAQVQSVS
jgi:protein-disulfide isomerase